MNHTYVIAYNNEQNPSKVLFKLDQKKPDFFLVRYAFLVSKSLLTAAFAHPIMMAYSLSRNSHFCFYVINL